MSDDVRRAIEQDRVIDITTTGRTSGQPRRIEIWYHNLGGRLYVTGRPGPRSWYANLVANPELTFHLKRSVQADLPARARPIIEADERREVLSKILERIQMAGQIEQWVEGAPLVEVKLGSLDG